MLKHMQAKHDTLLSNINPPWDGGTLTWVIFSPFVGASCIPREMTLTSSVKLFLKRISNH